jgi:hypothetical protein
MFLRPNHRDKDGKDHTYWSLVEPCARQMVRVRKRSAIWAS